MESIGAGLWLGDMRGLGGQQEWQVVDSEGISRGRIFRDIGVYGNGGDHSFEPSVSRSLFSSAELRVIADTIDRLEGEI
ncbi:MAG: hypothetical protein C4542_07985 [Dehalococcoidia bacterium]|nr:MAG: hypothetical protein C4542_07985 [Dehalococcoidia bacterium]